MATRGQTELTKSERRAREAIDGMKNDQIWKLGEYKTNVTGGSLRASLAGQFCDRNGVQKGDTLAAYMHSETGALVLLPITSNEED